MTTPTVPTLQFLPALTSSEFASPTPSTFNGGLPVPSGFQIHPGPYNFAAGTLFVFTPTSGVIAGSSLNVYADVMANPNSQQLVLPSQSISFPPITIQSNTAPLLFSLRYQNNAANISGIVNDPGYEVYFYVATPQGYVYGFGKSFFGFWLK